MNRALVLATQRGLAEGAREYKEDVAQMLEAERGSRERRRERQVRALERVFLPFILWGTFWGTSFNFFREQPRDSTPSWLTGENRVMDVGGLVVGERWVLLSTLILAYLIVPSFFALWNRRTESE